MRWSASIPVNAGSTTVTLTATDIKGNTSSREVSVRR